MAIGAYISGGITYIDENGKEQQRIVTKYFQCTHSPEVMLLRQALSSGMIEPRIVSKFMEL